MGFCNNIDPNCDVCFEVLYGKCNDVLTLSLGLTPSTEFFLNLTDKFDIVTQLTVTTDISGDFTITQTWTEFFGDIEVEIYSDSDRTILVSIEQDFTAYACVLLTAELSGSNDLVTDGAYVNALSTEFDGVDQFININPLQVALEGDTEGAITFRMKIPVSSVNNYTAFSIGDTDGDSLFLFQFSNLGAVAQVALEISGTIEWVLRLTAPTLGTDWFHFGISHDGSDATLYLNGVEPAQSYFISNNIDKWISAGDGLFDNARLGSQNSNGSGEVNFLDGFLDEVRVWNTSKSATFFELDHNRGVSTTPDPVGLVTSYKMGDDGLFTILVDKVGGNNGTMVNMASTSFVADVST